MKKILFSILCLVALGTYIIYKIPIDNIVDRTFCYMLSFIIGLEISNVLDL